MLEDGGAGNIHRYGCNILESTKILDVFFCLSRVPLPKTQGWGESNHLSTGKKHIVLVEKGRKLFRYRAKSPILTGDAARNRIEPGTRPDMLTRMTCDPVTS